MYSSSKLCRFALLVFLGTVISSWVLWKPWLLSNQRRTVKCKSKFGLPMERGFHKTQLLFIWVCTIIHTGTGYSYGTFTPTTYITLTLTPTLLRSFGSSDLTAWNDMPSHLRNLDLIYKWLQTIAENCFVPDCFGVVAACLCDSCLLIEHFEMPVIIIF